MANVEDVDVGVVFDWWRPNFDEFTNGAAAVAFDDGLGVLHGCSDAVDHACKLLKLAVRSRVNFAQPRRCSLA